MVDVRGRLRLRARTAPWDGGRGRFPARPGALRGVARIGRRIGWGLADQALSSAANFAVGVLVARSVSTSEFGSFSLAFTTYLIALNVSRGLTTDPLNVRFSHVEPSVWRRAAAGATGTAIQLGAVLGIGCLAMGLLLHGPLRVSLLALGVTLPGLLLQDAWRHAFFSDAKGARAFVTDLTWVVVQLALYAVLFATGRASLGLLVLAWGGAACVAGGAGCALARLLPRPSLIAGWLRAQLDLGTRYLAENLTISGAVAAWMYGLGVVAGLGAVGALRAAELVVFGPLNVVFHGIFLMAIPEAVRLLRRGTRHLLAASVAIGGTLAVVALAWGTIVQLTPGRAGQALLHDTWDPARVLLLPATIFAVLIGVTSGAEVGLRALGQANRSLASRVTASSLSIAGVLTGGALAGARGAVWGLAATGVVSTLVWWAQLLRGARAHQPGDRGPTREQPVGPAWHASTTTPGTFRLMIGDFVYEPPAEHHLAVPSPGERAAEPAEHREGDQHTE